MSTIQALIVTSDALADIEQLNIALNRNNKLIPSTAADGRRFLPVDLLTDMSEGSTWYPYADILGGLAVDVVTLVVVPLDVE